LLLAYTNRFLGLASVIRKLHADHEQTQHPHYLGEIENLRKRVNLIRDMQTVGTGSLLCCTLSMALLFFGWTVAAQVMFSISLVLMAASLTISILEIRMSVGALDLHLADLKSARDQISKSDPSSS
jgi:cobalamin biosynthesis protein CobD/CbiB